MYNNSNYKIVTCPKCGQREAFIYLSDVDKALEGKFDSIIVTCNRLNNCGFKDHVKLEDLGFSVGSGNTPSKQAEIIKKQIAMEERNRRRRRMTSPKALDSMVKFKESKDEFPLATYRGIQKETFNHPNISFIKEGFLETLENKPEYEDMGAAFKTMTYSGRDILFWVNDWEGNPSRLVMRSVNTVSKSDKKEVTMVLPVKTEDKVPLQKTKDKGRMLYTVWNADEIMANKDLTHIIACEGIYDALSIMEVNTNPNVGVVSLIGVSQTKRLLQLIEAYEIKHGTKLGLALAYDNDRAGNRFAEDAADKYKQLFKKDAVRWLPAEFEDFNDYYENKPDFMRYDLTLKIKNL